MLNGAGGLNADGLALDLQFAADKTLTARKGPTPVFTRGSTGTFVGSNGLIQSAAINTPRFDHDSAGVCRGLLIEESRTNLILQSDNFASASWTKTASVVSSNVETAPDGSVSADKLITDNGVTLGRATQTVTLTGSHVYSVFAKASEWGWISIFPLGAAGGVWFNLTNGTIGTQSSGYVGSITSFGNGWYRCAVSFTGVGTANTTARIISTNVNNAFSTGDGTSGIFIWGAQLEAGSFPTSYIPTTTGTLARSADVCNITGANFTSLYNQSQGTLLSEASIANLIGNNRGIVQIDDDLTNNFIRHVYGVADGGFRSLIRANIDAQTPLSVVTGAASTIQKRAIAYAGTSFASSANGAAVETATRTMPTGLNNIKIGYLFTGSFYLSGTIAAIRYYKKRLPNAKLVTLTT